MPALVITDQHRLDAAWLMRHAAANPVDVKTNTVNGALLHEPLNADPRHCMVFPVGFHCVFSYDLSTEGKLVRHLSVYMTRLGKAPHPIAMRMIMEVFSFEVLPLDLGEADDPVKWVEAFPHGRVWMEDMPNGQRAVHIAQYVR